MHFGYQKSKKWVLIKIFRLLLKVLLDFCLFVCNYGRSFLENGRECICVHIDDFKVSMQNKIIIFKIKSKPAVQYLAKNLDALV
jgi:hypothetical protein